MNYVVESYENYKEEDRLTTNNARKIEFITTTRVLDEVIDAESKILDCAAGTGVYAFWLVIPILLGKKILESMNIF